MERKVERQFNPSEFAVLLRQQMNRLNLRPVEVVRLMGYGNINKGCRRVKSWLGGREIPSHGQLQILSSVLEFPDELWTAAIQRDANRATRKRRAARAADPRYRLTIRLMAAVYTTQYLPGELSLAQALAEACDLAKRMRRRVCLNCPDDQSIYVGVDGDPVGSIQGREPSMRIGGRPFRIEALTC